MSTKVEVTSKAGKKYGYTYQKFVVLLDKDNAELMRAYADKFFAKLNGDGNVSQAIRHILTTVFDLARNPEIARMIKEDPSLNNDPCLMLRKMADEYIKRKDEELDDESWETRAVY